MEMMMTMWKVSCRLLFVALLAMVGFGLGEASAQVGSATIT